MANLDPEIDFSDREVIVDRFERLEYKQDSVNENDISACISNKVCGDEIHLSINIDDGVIRYAHFKGKGCMVTQVAADILCEMLCGMAVERAKQIDPNSLMVQLRWNLTFTRKNCFYLPFRCLAKIFEGYSEE